VIWVCGATCLPVSTVHAQQLSSSDFSTTSREIGNGWWSPERTASTEVIPHLQVSMVDQTRLSTSKLLPPTSETGNYRSISQADSWIGNQPTFQLRREMQLENPGSMAEGELLYPESVLSVLQSKYASWESNLEDSGPRTNVNGLVVYSLLQINYAGWHLPISMYIPPLRGSNARR
jgi:hypothetical protein